MKRYDFLTIVLSNIENTQRMQMGADVSQRVRNVSPVAGFFYDTGLSMVDNLVNRIMFGGTGAIGSDKMLEWASLAAMGAGAFENSYAENLERGMDDDHAFMTALGNGVNETLFEKLSLDRVVQIKNRGGFIGWAKGIRDALVSGGVEASEEVFTELANMTWDGVMNGKNSELEQMKEQLYQQYRMMGEGQADAWSKANAETLKQSFKNVLLAGAGGFVSGGLMTGGRLAMNNVQVNQLAGELRTMGMNREEAVRTANTMYRLGIGDAQQAYRLSWQFSEQGLERIADRVESGETLEEAVSTEEKENGYQFEVENRMESVFRNAAEQVMRNAEQEAPNAEQENEGDVREQEENEQEQENANQSQQDGETVKRKPRTRQEIQEEKIRNRTAEVEAENRRLREGHSFRVMDERGEADGESRLIEGIRTAGGRTLIETRNEYGEPEEIDLADVVFDDPGDEELVSAGREEGGSGIFDSLNTAGKAAYLAGYKDSVNGQSVSTAQYANAFKTLYGFAKNGLPMQEAVQRLGDSVKAMDISARWAAYQAGNASLQAKMAQENRAKQEKEDQKAGKHVMTIDGDGQKVNVVMFAENRRNSDSEKFHREYKGKLNRAQEENARILNELSGKFGVSIHLVDGMETSRAGVKANGMYQNGEVYVSRQAVDGAISYVALHEIAHAMREQNRDAFDGMSAFLTANAEKIGLDAEAEYGKLRKLYGMGEELTDEEIDYLNEEFAANNLPAILESRAVRDDLKNWDSRTWGERLRDGLKDLIA